ncbi:MAG: RagB/SusD family nutrient uptake outer membrane protein [Salegentibacter mishustinae]|nr:RagB/SusD family nutrient uptake outer membrane protein [Salegentibacter mishustinae]
MKNYNLIFLLMVVIFTSGCEDFLEEEPVDEIALDQYFTEPEHARDAVNALYRTGAMQLYPGDIYAGSRIMFGPWVSGYVDNDYKGQEVHVGYAQNLNYTPSNLSSYFNGMWSDMYLGISRANTAIKYIPELEELSDQERSQYLAEAHFFRALNYFYLVRLFGGVPLITAPYESIGDLEVERSNTGAVYNLIVDDLNLAINTGGLSSGNMPGNNGRITKEVAQTVLADVYLTRSGRAGDGDYYAEAAEVAKKVINSGVYNLTQHELNENGELSEGGSAYNQIKDSRLPANEFIYYYEYQIGIANSTYPAWSYPVSLSPEVSYAIVNNAYKPTSDLLNAYDLENDLRIQEKQYFHSSDVLPNGEEIQFETAPHMWKDEEALFETALSDNATQIYTYSNVLLIAAESIAKSEGVTSEAVEYLSKVRERAYWKNDPEAIRASLSGLSSEVFAEEVLKERVRELVFEFTIWFDIIRTGKFPDSNGGEINFVDVVGSSNNFDATIEESDLLLPIPELEMQRNSLLTQNPGY